MRTLNLNDTVEAVREIINSVGADFIYTDSEAYKEMQTCVYAYNGEPSCIVGKFLIDVEGHSALSLSEGVSAFSVIRSLGYDMSDHQTRLAAQWLAWVQEEQDGLNTTWGDAFDAAQGLSEEFGLS